MPQTLQELRTKEKNFEEYIESYFLSANGGYTKGSDVFDTQYGIYKNTLINFIKETQSKEWKRFENQNPGRLFKAFKIAV